MNRIIIVFVFFCMAIMTEAQSEKHIIKTNCNVNDLFKGNGFVFESLGYEYVLNLKQSFGFRVGWDFKTSKIELKEESNATNSRNLLFAMDYYYFPFQRKNSLGVYFSPELCYLNGIQTVDNQKSHGYGLNISIGYRVCFNPLVLDCALFSGYKYMFQENDFYKYRSKEITPLGIKLVVGFILGK